MSGYQFVHVETYARVPSRNKKKQSARGVAAEAERKPEACPHIEDPKPFKLLYGVTPSEAVDMAEDRAAKAKDPMGRKFRKDGQMILGGVASYPVPSTDVKPSDPAFKKWLDLTHDFLLDKYGDTYKSLILHYDEEYIHVHFYCVPDLDDSGRMDIGQVHQGIAARNAVGGKKAKAKTAAYKSAMRDYQDDYYQAVGMKCGLSKDGPRRRRLSRKEWKAEQDAAERLASSLRSFDLAQELVAKLEYKSAALEQKNADVCSKGVKAVTALKRVKAEREKLEMIKSSDSSLVVYLKKKVKSLASKVKSLVMQVARLKDDNAKLSSDLRESNRRLAILQRQNEVQANGLEQYKAEMHHVYVLAKSGRADEITDFYDFSNNNNNNEEFTYERT